MTERSRNGTNRRTFLLAAGTAVTTATAGCLSDSEEAPELYTTPAAAEFDNVVDTQWLEENLDDVHVVDIRPQADYTTAHVEGAYHLDEIAVLRQRFAAAEDEQRELIKEDAENAEPPLPAMTHEDADWVPTDEYDSEYLGLLPNLNPLIEVAEEAGIDSGDDVVVYSAGSDHYATRTAFLFAAASHGGDVRILDGGFPAWDAADAPTGDGGGPEPAGGSYDPELDLDVTATRGYVAENVHEDGADIQIIDQRSPEEHIGPDEVDLDYHHSFAFERLGHIPGSININHPMARQTTDDMEHFRDQDDLETLYLEDGGLDPNEPLMSYCVSGIRSSMGWFVLDEMLGWDDRVRVFEGSWKDWGNLSDEDGYYAATGENVIVDTFA